MPSLSTHFRVDGSLFLLIGLHVFTMATSVQLQYHEPVFTLLIATVYGPVLATTILIHEFAQAATKRWCQQQPKDAPYTTPVHQEVYCTLAGPLSHIPQALLWLYLYVKLTITHGNTPLSKMDLEIDMDNLKEGGSVAFVSTMAMQALVMNVVMFHLNIIIPVHPFPGARGLVAILVLAGCTFSTAGMVTSVIGIFMGILAFWAALLLMILDYNVVAFCLGTLSCYTIFSGARLLRMTVTGNVQDHVLFRRDCYRNDSTNDCEQKKRRRRKGVSSDNEGESIVVTV